MPKNGTSVNDELVIKEIIKLVHDSQTKFYKIGPNEKKTIWA